MNSQPIGRTPGPAPPSATVPAAETPDPAFGGLARLAASACGRPMASITVFGSGQTWCTSTAELPSAATPRCDPFADYAAQAAGLFEVPNAGLDKRFRRSELVTGALAVRSYAGC